MIELLRDPAWQFAGAVLAFFAILVSLATYHAQRAKKRLAYEVIHNGRILTIKEESVGDLQLVFRQQPVCNARLIEVRVTNQGNQPITPGDFVRPLSLSLNQDAVVLSAATVQKEPNDLSIDATYTANVIEIAPLLLNPKDSFTIKLLASEYQSGPSITARISGVSKITEIVDRAIVEPILMLLSNACALTAMAALPAGDRTPPPTSVLEIILDHLLSVSLIVAGLFFMIWTALRLIKRGKRDV
jgi:hypothetical protein